MNGNEILVTKTTLKEYAKGWFKGFAISATLTCILEIIARVI